MPAPSSMGERAPLRPSVLFEPPTSPNTRSKANDPEVAFIGKDNIAHQSRCNAIGSTMLKIGSDCIAGLVIFLFGCVFAISAAHTYLDEDWLCIGIQQCFIGMVITGVVMQCMQTKVPCVASVPDVFVALFFANVRRKFLGTGSLLLFSAVAQACLGATLAVVSRVKLLRIADWIPAPVACGLLAGVGICVLRMAAALISTPTAWAASIVMAALLRARDNDAKWKLSIVVLGFCAFQIYPAHDLCLEVNVPPLIHVVPMAANEVLRQSDPFKLARGATADFASLIVVILLKESLMYSSLPRVFENELQDGRFDANRELQILGYASGCVGMCFGIYCPPSLGPILIARGFGSPSNRGPPSIVVILALIGALRGMRLDIPNFVCAALLLVSGLKLVEQQLLRQYSKLPHSQFTVIVAICVAMPTLGLLEGIGLGIAASLVLFAREYMAVGGVKHAGPCARSAVQRNASQESELRKTGASRQYLQLQGYLFFGNASPVLHLARLFARTAKQIIVDFTFVAALDASAVEIFDRLAQIASRHGCAIRFCGVSNTVYRQLKLGCSAQFFRSVTFHRDADAAIDAAECAHLSASCSSLASLDDSLASCLAAAGSKRPEYLAEHLKPYVDTVTLKPGERLGNRDASAPSIYFVSKGRVILERDQAVATTLASLTVLGHAFVDDSPSVDQRRQICCRIADCGAGAIVGLEAFVLGCSSLDSHVTAAADAPAKLYRITQTQFGVLKGRNLPIAFDLLEFCAMRLAKRNERTYDQLAHLRDAFLAPAASSSLIGDPNTAPLPP